MRLLNLFHEIRNLRTVSICMGNSRADLELFNAFNKKHPRFYVIRNKTVGIGLIQLDAFSSPEKYVEAVNGKNSAAYFARKAQRAGYLFSGIDPNRFTEAIHAIHLSTEERQGIAIDSAYLKKIEQYPVDERNEFYGILKGNELVAYLWIVRSGELLLMNRIMGHAAHLKEGIMYLLVTQFIQQELKARTDLRTAARFVMYDTMLGATPGLRMFKERCGFHPFRVTWKMEGSYEGA